MKLYLKLLRNAFHSNFAYKFDAFFRVIQEIIKMVVQLSVWTALYAVAGSAVGGIELKTMISYAIISAGVNSLVSTQVIYLVESKIKTGMIAMDFIKPMNFMGYLLADSLGNSLYQFLFRFLPLLLIFCPIFGLELPSLEMFLAFTAALLGGIFLNFLLSYIMGLLGFWYLSVWHLKRVLSDLTYLFSGSFIPLWFFPGFLYTIALCLPFRFIYFVPISIFLEQVALPEVPILLATQWIWILALFGLSQLIWRLGRSKLIVQGG